MSLNGKQTEGFNRRTLHHKFSALSLSYDPLNMNPSMVDFKWVLWAFFWEYLRLATSTQFLLPVFSTLKKYCWNIIFCIYLYLEMWNQTNKTTTPQPAQPLKTLWFLYGFSGCSSWDFAWQEPDLPRSDPEP